MRYRAYRRSALVALAIWIVAIAVGYLSVPELNTTWQWSAPAAGTRSATSWMAFSTVTGILARNVAVAAVMMLGVVSYGVPTVVCCAFNGTLLGFMIGTSVAIKVPASAMIWAIAPHGPLELVALILASTIGLQGWTLHRRRRGIAGEFKAECKVMARIGAVVVGLLCVAAVLEATVSLPMSQHSAAAYGAQQ